MDGKTQKSAATDTIIADFDNAFRRALVDTRERLEALIPGAGTDFESTITKVLDESLRPGMDALDLTISRRVAGEADRSRAVQGDPAILWQNRLDANFTTRQMPRVLALVERIEAVIGERGPVFRMLKATPGWQIGETFLRLPDLVEFLSDDAAVQTAATVADREKALANARAM